MTTDPSRQRIAVDFITRHVDLLPAELARGYHLGYINEQDVVLLAETAVGRGHSSPSAMEELSCLLRDEIDRVPDLIGQLDHDGPADDLDPSRVWLFLVLLLAWERRGISPDALDRIEEIYADFDYPEEIEGFIPFLPAPEGDRPGKVALERRWRSYLDDREREFSLRERPGAS